MLLEGLAVMDVMNSLCKTSECGRSVDPASGELASSTTITHRQLGGRYYHDHKKKGAFGWEQGPRESQGDRVCVT